MPRPPPVTIATWPASIPAMCSSSVLGGAGEVGAVVEAGVGARRRRHQEPVALRQDALDVVGVDVRVADGDVVRLAGRDDLRHLLAQCWVVVLAREAELLAEVALADEDGADAGHGLEDVRQVPDPLDILDHEDDEDLALRAQRPDVRLRVVLLLGEAPVAGGRPPAAAPAARPPPPPPRRPARGA